MKKLLFLLLIFISCTSTKLVPKTGYEKGCVYTGTNAVTGNAYFIFFVKTGDKDYPNEDGKPEIWGYNPQDPPEKKDGTYWMRNYLKERFVLAGGAKTFGTALLRCPAW